MEVVNPSTAVKSVKSFEDVSLLFSLGFPSFSPAPDGKSEKKDLVFVFFLQLFNKFIEACMDLSHSYCMNAKVLVTVSGKILVTFQNNATFTTCGNHMRERRAGTGNHSSFSKYLSRNWRDVAFRMHKFRSSIPNSIHGTFINLNWIWDLLIWTWKLRGSNIFFLAPIANWCIVVSYSSVVDTKPFIKHTVMFSFFLNRRCALKIILPLFKLQSI